jgi:formylglycine-generating enzyme required for sulfatase activity
MLKPTLTSCSILLFCCILLAGQPRNAPPQPAVPAATTKVNGMDGLKYVWIPPATFQMGCSVEDGECFDNELPAHPVTITKGFWMGQTEVTQTAYQRVAGNNPSYFKGAQLPVENVNWSEAQFYCQTIGMRLPKEAEWEYAARGGMTTSRYGVVDRIAWYADNSMYGDSGRKTHEVGQKAPNRWGLYDMLGNVWEWVADWYAEKYPAGGQSDPAGPASGNVRVLRGGSWNYAGRSARGSQRLSATQDDREANFGFRCAGN